jgi:hypothetical protein
MRLPVAIIALSLSWPSPLAETLSDISDDELFNRSDAELSVLPVFWLVQV